MNDEVPRIVDENAIAMQTPSPLHLDERINHAIEYTLRDEAITSLKDVVTCIILLDTSPSMLIFNNHFYDK